MHRFALIRLMMREDFIEGNSGGPPDFCQILNQSVETCQISWLASSLALALIRSV